MSILQSAIKLAKLTLGATAKLTRRMEFLPKYILPIAGIVIAIYAYKIQEGLVSQEKERAAISRSIALYRQFSESRSVKHLLNVAHQLQVHLSSPDGQGRTMDALVGAYSQDKFDRKKPYMRKWLSDVLQDVTTIYRCGNYEEKFVNSTSAIVQSREALCDRYTISVLFGEKLTEIFYMLRPMLYCDGFMRKTYFDRRPTSDIGKFESLIMDHLERDVRGSKYEVFRTEIHWLDVEDKVGDDYRIVRLPEMETRCKAFERSKEYSQEAEERK